VSDFEFFHLNFLIDSDVFGLEKFQPNFAMYSLWGTKTLSQPSIIENTGASGGDSLFVLFKHLNNVHQVQHTTGQNFFEELNTDIEPIWFDVKEPVELFTPELKLYEIMSIIKISV
jgi:hypothetical protein